MVNSSFIKRMQEMPRIAGIFIRGAVSALFHCHKVNESRRIPIKQHLPRIISGWDYRPKQDIRRWSAVQTAGMEINDLSTSSGPKDKSSKVFDDRWLDFGLDCFVNADAAGTTVDGERIKASLSDHEHGVSAYDQSPIDEGTPLLHHGRDHV
jgi:hypothetical protein